MTLHRFLFLAVLLPILLLSNVSLANNIKSGSVSQPFVLDPGKDSSRAEAELLIQQIENSESPQYADGFRLIKLVTQQEFSDLYEKSCELYLEGLNQKLFTEKDQEVLKEDLLHLSPFFGRREANGYEEMIDEQNPEIFSVFRNFWEDRDLTPSDSYNERLMEHWQRVHFALNNFNTTSRALYDDRGGIYIRYGEPNKKRSGIFMYNPGFANYIIATRMDDGRGGVANAANAINTTLYLNTLYQVREYHQYPSFETWVYENLVDHSESVIYLFGNTYGGNEMNIKQSVDDFVPSAAYSMTDRNSPVSMSMVGGGNGGEESEESGGDDEEDSNVLSQLSGGDLGSGERISPALVLQFMYYRQLASLDEYFSSQYNEMLNRYMDISLPVSNSLARQFQQTNSARLLIANSRAPQEYSSGNDEMFDIGTSVHAYRFYNEELSPELRIYFEDDVEEAVSYDQLREINSVDSISYSHYEIVRTLEIEKDREEASETVKIVHPAENGSADPLSFNTLEIPLREDIVGISSVSELHNTRVDDGAIRTGSVFRERIKGIGSSEISIEPAEVDIAGFFTSDVILGYRNAESPGDLIIAHNRQIPGNSSINFYYEAYNLPENSEGLYSIALTYTIERDRSAIGSLLRFWKNEQTSMTITNTNDRPVFDQMLEIVTEELDPGNYNLILEFSETEEESQALYTKEIPFEISDK
jgi:GWxTD domain-containing protein